jgi:hypothetical protein
MGRVDWARDLAKSLLAEPLPRRWAHTQGVAGTARRLAPILGEDAELIEAAGWLHDIGYSPALVDTRFHPLDGARYLRDRENVDSVLCSLVAYHTGAVNEAAERGLGTALTSEFAPPPEPLATALTYSDITTGPDGDSVNVEERLADILRRYAPEDPVSRAVRKSSAAFIETVRDIEARLAS